jgi:DNA polymerase-3 subunit beta
MNISILQEHLYKAMVRASRIIGTKPQLPITSHILLEATLQSITLTATNLETTIKTTLLGKCLKEGSICLPAKIFTELLSTLPKEAVQIEVEQEQVTIKTGKTKSKFPGISSAEFPPIVPLSVAKGIIFSKEFFDAAVSKVLFSAATDESRPLLMGVLFESDEEHMNVVTTDGYRLSKSSIKTTHSFLSALVVPARALLEIVKIGQEEKEVKEISISETKEGQLQYTIGETQISTRQIEGEFPKYKKRIPESYKTKIQIDKEDLLRAVRSASIFARESSGIIKIDSSSQAVTVSANTPQVGENTIDTDGTHEGEECSIALNSRFVSEVLSVLPDETITIEISGALNPVVFKIASDITFIHIIMPVRVQQ